MACSYNKPLEAISLSIAQPPFCRQVFEVTGIEAIASQIMLFLRTLENKFLADT
ncbi:MAG: hypothetical protein P5702_07055 [Limnospira sp. PMC 1291.21]|uniref:hypothetical protein n=1 Tax=Limnospira TaxID=2596745 RepID=UPI00186048DC|nr:MULTISPECIES: hypothetical protein [Limnospira]MDT9177217.1 hypothetical protein [Limnospira sp. PMC 1238.20]MDT9192442.1 hypothetical protein [Limnospira sp. PMC 1245.20]MDT9202633.1 hypothetical protein [Limnospira sp. PMC 1243.20]MDT9207960.1 hypothetical protein [Limnospira sp. PMC 1252.20]MDT9213049.1 hypothetical protein [Limnospira sp. PMC 1256.20]